MGSGSASYELIEKSEFFGMPEDVIEMTKKQMLEGELARSVAALKSFRGAFILRYRRTASLSKINDQPRQSWCSWSAVLPSVHFK